MHGQHLLPLHPVKHYHPSQQSAWRPYAVAAVRGQFWGVLTDPESVCWPLLCPVQEIGDLRQALSKEVDELRSEFSDLKAALKQQIAAMNAAQQASNQAAGNDAAGAQ